MVRSFRDSRQAYAAIGSIRLASLFFMLPTRALTGWQVISTDGNGASRAFRSDRAADPSPSQTGVQLSTEFVRLGRDDGEASNRQKSRGRLRFER